MDFENYHHRQQLTFFFLLSLVTDTEGAILQPS